MRNLHLISHLFQKLSATSFRQLSQASSACSKALDTLSHLRQMRLAEQKGIFNHIKITNVTRDPLKYHLLEEPQVK